MHAGARAEYTSIKIDENGSWFTDEKKIINPDVLSFFRHSLFRDEGGIYIFNEFRGLAEKGYIKVNGPLMMVEQVKADHFILSDDSQVLRKQATLAIDHDSTPYLFVPRLKGWAGFPARVAHAFANDLTQDEHGFYWQGSLLKQYSQMPWDGNYEL